MNIPCHAQARIPVHTWMRGLLATTAFAACALGCGGKGPAETSGAAVDKAAHDTVKGVEKAADATGKALEKGADAVVDTAK